MFNLRRFYKKSYSQCGEDVNVGRILSLLDIKNPGYLDIGANEPIFKNNTYFLYEQGFSGVNIEPDPIIFGKLRSKRRRDVNLNIGIGKANTKLTFYVLSSNTLSTFSKETAQRYVDYGNQKIEKELMIDVVDVNLIVKQYFQSRSLNFISLDVEGLDMEILKSFDFTMRRPEIFCVETLTYTENNTESKLTGIIEYMESVGYFPQSDTYVNTIFVDSDRWKNRGKKLFRLA